MISGTSAVTDRVDRELADPRPAEDLLDDDHAAEEEAEVQTDLGQDRARRRCESACRQSTVRSLRPLARAVRT